ncbi:hypothetical protein KAR91_66185 [Candidatus Pacearchaeota archaeon]|nr:hypothetical protein [Candidatus Pacearchaeota archaeon]
MSKYEIAVAIKDFADNPGSKVPRMKEGEIIAVTPHPWSWAMKELCGSFIIIVESTRTLAEMQMFMRSIYNRLDTDELISESDVNFIEAQFQTVQKNIWALASTTKTIMTEAEVDALEPVYWRKVSTQDGRIFTVIEIIETDLRNQLTYLYTNRIEIELADKNRYRIPFTGIAANCQGLNISKVQDAEVFYQPFKKKSDCLEKFSDAKDTRYYIPPALMDTTADLTSEEEEIIISLDSAPFLIWDKLEGKWVK